MGHWGGGHAWAALLGRGVFLLYKYVHLNVLCCGLAPLLGLS